MAAIGGIVDFRNSSVDFGAVNAIRRAQALRGRGESTAYIDSGVGMFYSADDFSLDKQPILSERRGYKAALVMDSPFFDGRLAMEAYRAYGVEVVSMLDLPFALALYDSERRMLLLARDKKGKRPLYYCFKSGRVLFSSEPKGVLATKNEPIKINRDILSAHLTSPIGIYGASDIYTDIFEVRCGECILFTEVGMSRFFYRGNTERRIKAKMPSPSNERAISAFGDIDKKVLLSILDDALIAFDMPQFDAFMPSLCQIYMNVGGSQVSVFQFKDAIKRRSLLYSYEREDRFNAFYGKAGIGIMPKIEESEYRQIEYENNRILEVLTDIFFSMDRDGMLFLRGVFGDAKLNFLVSTLDKGRIKKEDTELYVRILGMLYQAVEWSRLRNLELLSSEVGGFCV